jgi:hypothetical protein
MTKPKNISETLNTLANFYIESYKDTVGDAPNDYFVTDLARSFTKIPQWSAAQKRKYIDNLWSDVQRHMTYDEAGRENPSQSKQFYDANAKYERLAPRIEMEAMALDAMFDAHKDWFQDYTGQEFTTDTRSQARKLTKQEQAAIKAIEARRVANAA